jgi:hypothetical protein
MSMPFFLCLFLLIVAIVTIPIAPGLSVAYYLLLKKTIPAIIPSSIANIAK